MGFKIIRSRSAASEKATEETAASAKTTPGKPPANLKQALHAKSTARRERLRSEATLRSVAAAPPSRNDLLPALKPELRDIKSLKPASRRMRKAGKDHVERIAKVIKAVGQCAPIIIDREGRIVDGHGVVEALKHLGVSQVWCVVVDHLDNHELEYLRIALNKLGDGSEWVIDDLRDVLVDLEEVGFDLSTTGFSLPELDGIMQPDADTDGALNELPEPPAEPVSRPGDLWELGAHRLLCGDATDPENYVALLGDELADGIFTDPPWNIRIENNVSGLGKRKHKDFKMAVGEMSEAEFARFTDQFMTLAAASLAEGGVVYTCIDWRSIDVVTAAGKAAGLRHIGTAVWSKGSGGMGALYRSAYELVPIFCKGKSPGTNNVRLGRHGRDRTNVWAYPGANKPGSSAAKALADHPTPKPVELVEDALLDTTARGELVLDPFLGSGTTLLAAERSGRRARGIELDPAYVDVCVRRWEELTGKSARLHATGASFTETARERLSAMEGDA